MGKKRFGVGTLILTFFLSFIIFCGVAFYGLVHLFGNHPGIALIARTAHLITQYYDGDYDEKSLYNGALKGMVEQLHDPYSAFLDEKDFESLSVMTEGHFGGVGMVVGMKENKEIVVVSPIEDTPAYKAGIKAGERIIRIDGEDLTGQSLNDVVKKLRGKDGTKVSITLVGADHKEREVTLTRSEIKMKSVYGRMEDDRIGYIRVTNFNEDTGRDFAAELKKLQENGMQALVLDLRDNPGGLLQSGVSVARFLVPKGPIVSVTDKNGQTEVESSDLEKVPFPLAVLVNHGTASAAEIVSGAIQDTHSGRLFGIQTFGKGVVQNIFMLNHKPDTAVKLTIAKYYTPSGRSIDKVGITPDEVVEPSDAQGTNQLEAAKNYLNQVLAGK
jgi:carboxyl-terminal processing protease